MSTLAPRYDDTCVRRRIAPYFEFSSERHYPIKTMNFSELLRQSHQLCRFSPDGKYLASAIDYRLVVRDVETLQIHQLFSCLDAVQHIEWSSDSLFVLCGMFKRGIVQVWSLENPEWQCKVDEGSAGLCAARWAPDGRHILTTADFYLRITIWSLVTKSVSYIRYPKQCQKGLDFSDKGKYLALAERRDCKDFVSIFACDTWSLVRHFQTETDDLDGLEWSPDGRVLCVWDSCLTYQLLLYSLDGRCVARYSAYDYALGIKCIAWSPSAQFLVVGSFDEKVRILNHVTWKTICTLTHSTTVNGSSVVIYRETEARATAHSGGELSTPTATLFAGQSKYEIEIGSFTIPVVKPTHNKANPKVGVSCVSFSPDCKYVYTKNDNMPTVLWIWDVPQLKLCTVLIQASPIKCVKWDPLKPRLALCTGSNKLYMWSPEGSLCVDIPAEASFQVTSVQWQPDGGSLLLVGRDQMCVCFLTASGEVTDTTATTANTTTSKSSAAVAS